MYCRGWNFLSITSVILSGDTRHSQCKGAVQGDAIDDALRHNSVQFSFFMISCFVEKCKLHVLCYITITVMHVLSCYKTNKIRISPKIYSSILMNTKKVETCKSKSINILCKLKILRKLRKRKKIYSKTKSRYSNFVSIQFGKHL